jgi:septum formation protein
LLREAGFVFTAQASDVDEDFDPSMPAEAVAEHLAVRKAGAMRHLIQDREVILSADSVVILDNVIYNKPADHEEAFYMIRQLSGRQHTVITGVCILTADRQASFSGVSKVWFAPLSDEEIDYYIKTCQPFDKAGAYGVQEWIGHCKISKIEGTYANVMGLPVDLVYEALRTIDE